MGDVLPPKRQTVVDRLRRRFDLYRRHHNGCLPRYEQAADALFDRQRQDTLLLKQRFLESKTKKAKNSKSDHHHRAITNKESAQDTQKLVTHPKPVKRGAEEPLITPTLDGAAEDKDRATKIARKDNSSLDQTQAQEQPSTPSFSVQIVQNFTNSNPAQAQTIQTNVTVKTFGGPIKASDSSVANNLTPQSVTVNQTQQLTTVKKNQSSGVVNQCQNVPSIDQKESQTTSVSVRNNIECKQEKENGPDLCQCRSQTSSSGGDRLSDTFPSIGFTEDSGDDVIHPDILKDLIDDVFTNSADIMKDFNFEDSVGSVKDPDEAEKDDIDALVKRSSSPSQLQPFQPNNLMFSNNHSNQQGGLFDNSSANTPATMTAITATTTSSTTSSLYATPQRLPSFGGASLGLSSGLGLDFKLTEPSPAALTLKQMAEQHQNMQQKQQQMGQSIGSPHNGRPQFNQESFSDPLSNFRSRFMNGTGPNPKVQNSGMFNSISYDPMSGYPGIKSLPAGNVFKQESMTDTQKQRLLQMTGHGADQKPPSYGATRPLTHYSDGMGPNGVNHHQMSGQYTTNVASDVRLQMNQPQQLHVGHNPQLVQSRSPEMKQQQMMVQPHSTVYGGYNPQTGANPMFHMAMSQSLSYTAQFGSSSNINRPPPEYKIHQPNMAPSNLTMLEQNEVQPHMTYHHPNKNAYLRHQRPPNIAVDQDRVAINPRSNDWRHIHQQPPNPLRLETYPHQEDYGQLLADGSLSTAATCNTLHRQYRIVGGQMNLGRMPRPNLMSPNQAMMAHRQQMSMSHRPVNPSLSSIDVQALGNGTASPMTPPMYNSHTDLVSRQDNNQINLDFLDNIESSASDLLNFDQVMQGSGTHFQLLDDMDMLSK